MFLGMRHMFVALAASVGGCAVPAPPPLATPSHAVVEVSTSSRSRAVRFIEDDLATATTKARAEGKALFMDAWAPWCHTCLSMKHFVLSDPALQPLADRVVFASLDTDRPEAAAFLERHAVTAWPTFFVIDPTTDRVLGYWAGSGSLAEMRGFIEESLAVLGGGLDPASRAYAEARMAHAAGELKKAATAYESAIAAAPAAWPNHSAAVLGWIEALAGAKAWDACVQVGLAHLGTVRGSSAPVDVSSYLLSCAGKLSVGPEQTLAKAQAVARLRELTVHPPADASVDDRQDALDVLSEALKDEGDTASARRAQEQRLRLLEQAVQSATTPEIVHTFDQARAGAYVALGRAEDAVRMLEQRERELPEAYEPPARLAGVLLKVGRLVEARAAIERAMARAYGPRRLRYLELRAEIQAKQGDVAGARATLREVLAGVEKLPPGQASPERLSEARRKLVEAETRAPESL